MARLMVLLATLAMVGCGGGTAGTVEGPAVAEDSEQPSLCRENADCGDETQYCAKPPGKCDDEGECVVRPELCTTDYRPVCGCDGETYSNACNAAAAGQSFAYEGECRDDESG